MRTALFVAGSFVAIGIYLLIASILSFSAALIGIGVLAIAIAAALAAAAATPAPVRS